MNALPPSSRGSGQPMPSAAVSNRPSMTPAEFYSALSSPRSSVGGPTAPTALEASAPYAYSNAHAAGQPLPPPHMMSGMTGAVAYSNPATPQGSAPFMMQPMAPTQSTQSMPMSFAATQSAGPLGYAPAFTPAPSSSSSSQPWPPQAVQMAVYPGSLPPPPPPQPTAMGIGNMNGIVFYDGRGDGGVAPLYAATGASASSSFHPNTVPLMQSNMNGSDISHPPTAMYGAPSQDPRFALSAFQHNHQPPHLPLQQPDPSTMLLNPPLEGSLGGSRRSSTTMTTAVAAADNESLKVQQCWQFCSQIEQEVGVAEAFYVRMSQLEMQLLGAVQRARRVAFTASPPSAGNSAGGGGGVDAQSAVNDAEVSEDVYSAVPPSDVSSAAKTVVGSQQFYSDLTTCTELVAQLEQLEEVLIRLEADHHELQRRYVLGYRGSGSGSRGEAKANSHNSASRRRLTGSGRRGKEEENGDGDAELCVTSIQTVDEMLEALPTFVHNGAVLERLQQVLISLQARQKAIHTRLMEELLLQRRQAQNVAGCADGGDGGDDGVANHKGHPTSEAAAVPANGAEKQRPSDPKSLPHFTQTPRGSQRLSGSANEQKEPTTMTAAVTGTPLVLLVTVPIGETSEADGGDHTTQRRASSSSSSTATTITTTAAAAAATVASNRTSSASEVADTITAPTAKMITVIASPARYAQVQLFECLHERVQGMLLRLRRLQDKRDAEMQRMEHSLSHLDAYDPAVDHIVLRKHTVQQERDNLLAWEGQLNLLGIRLTRTRRQMDEELKTNAQVRRQLLLVLDQRLNELHSPSSMSLRAPTTALAAGGSAPLLLPSSSPHASVSTANGRSSAGGSADSVEGGGPQSPQSASRPTQVPPLPRASAVFLSMLESIANEQTTRQRAVGAGTTTTTTDPNVLSLSSTIAAEDAIAAAPQAEVKKTKNDEEKKQSASRRLTEHATDGGEQLEASKKSGPTDSVEDVTRTGYGRRRRRGEMEGSQRSDRSPNSAREQSASSSSKQKLRVEGATDGAANSSHKKKKEENNTMSPPYDEVDTDVIGVDEEAELFERRRAAEDAAARMDAMSEKEEFSLRHGGGLLRGLSAFVKAVVKRATTFSEPTESEREEESDSDDDSGHHRKSHRGSGRVRRASSTSSSSSSFSSARSDSGDNVVKTNRKKTKERLPFSNGDDGGEAVYVSSSSYSSLSSFSREGDDESEDDDGGHQFKRSRTED